MLVIAPERFKEAFQAAVITSEPEMLECWTDCTPFTSLIRGRVLPAIAANLGLRVYCERDYFWLDAIFYEEMDTLHFGEDSRWVKYISIALEHENSGTSSIEEMNKLQLFNTPLKVLVTYARPSAREELLKKFSRILLDADVFDDFSTRRKQVVVFGGMQGGHVEWTFYIYRDGSFASL